MNLREFQKLWDEMCDRLITAGKMVPREKLKNFPKENSARDDMVTIGAIFMPHGINHEEAKKKWRKYHRNRLRKENTNTGTNPVSVIAPYWDSGTWVFDDERVGLVMPTRSEGKRRLYSPRNIELIKRIKALTEDMGVNLAGAEVALKLMMRIEELEREVKGLTEQVRTQTPQSGQTR